MSDLTAQFGRATQIELERWSLGAASDYGTFEKPCSQHLCKSLILRGRICRSDGSEYICLMNRCANMRTMTLIVSR